MILRILLSLLILTYSPTAVSISQCSKISRDVVKCDSILAYNGTAKVIVVGDCPNLSQLDTISDFGPWPAVVNVTFDCDINDFPWSFTDIFPNVRYIHLNKCNLTTLPWQSVYAETLKFVDLSSCPMECSCQNQWMKADGSFERLKEPFTLKKCIPDCDTGYITINQSMIIGNAGENVTIHSEIRDQSTNRTFKKPYFEWAYAKIRHNYMEVVGESSADLVITNLTREDMGLIGVRCWHCVDYLTTTVEVRVNLPVKVEFVEKTRGDTDFLVVQGYPIENISLAITRVQSNYTETNIVDTENDAVFFSSLIVRPEKRSIFYQRTYRIFTKDIADGDHLSGDLRFEVCTNGHCDAVEKHVSHLGVINGTLDDYIFMEYPYKQEIQMTISILLICILSVLFVLSIVFRQKLRSYLREKIISFRKRISLAQDIHSRRASHETEETLLRLEERCSLASDYTNVTIQFIDIGSIEIHERIGHGHFADVYLGSWDHTGPRSVAVKNIPKVDINTEKEARVLQDLDHPNIVKLYGMTRDLHNLLLVFEHMNFGDLKSYLSVREPKSDSEYLQYPPPLVTDELKWIIKEITTGLVYLVENQIVHRDLAARNCLVSGESDEKSDNHLQRPPIKVKISDFGMSRRLYDHNEYYTMMNRGPLPVRWLPPEAVKSHRFTYMSDIWALGVTMWECMAYGKQPFEGLSNLEITSYSASDIQAMKPAKTERCPQEMYDLMNKCWKENPADRITALQILDDPIFDKIRHGLPYEPAKKEAPLVASYRANVNRFQDKVAETSFSNVSNGKSAQNGKSNIATMSYNGDAFGSPSLSANSFEMMPFPFA